MAPGQVQGGSSRGFQVNVPTMRIEPDETLIELRQIKMMSGLELQQK